MGNRGRNTRQEESPEAGEQSRLRRLAERGRVQRFKKGEIVIAEGAKETDLYVVRTGVLRAYSSDQDGRTVTYGIHGPGELLGEMSLDGGPRSATVVAVQASDCAVISRETLLAYITEQPEFSIDLLRRVICRARRTTRSVRNMALLDSYARLAQLLTDHSLGVENERSSLLVKMTKQEIASRIGASRPMVSRLLADLESGGYLRFNSGKVQLLRRLPPGW